MSKNQYDFENVIQKAPLTGKIQSRQGKLTSNNRLVTTNMRNTKTGFRTSEKLYQAQNKLKADKFKKEKDPEKRIKELEEEINNLINDSNLSLFQNNLVEALEKAKEAQTKMKHLERFLENNDLNDYISVELYFSVGMNLANIYEKNQLYQEALSEYKKLLNARANEMSFLVRVNMGNLYFQQENYSASIKMYKMALDMAPSKFNAIKYKIMKNIGHAYVKKKEFIEAISAYEDVINKYPDFETAFNLMLCLYTIGDKEKMKPSFCEMLNIETYWNIEEDTTLDLENKKNKLKEDPLLSELTLRRNKAIKYITDAAKLIAPIIETDILKGYEWLIETLKNSKYPDIQSEIEISKALYYVKSKNIDIAIESLKSFEKKDKKMMTLASTNLSFLYLLEKKYTEAEKYCDMALQYDRFNAKALVNKGNCYFHRNNFTRAKENYLEAIGIEADCVEALYNLSFVNKKINCYGEALNALEKLRSIISNSPEVLYQIANIYEMVGENKKALKWYDLLNNLIPNDPNIHAKIGMLYALEEDEAQAYYHYLEGFKLLPINVDIIAWLGIYYVKNLNYERACFFFERASLLQPKEIKWNLMIASCNRRMEKYEKALKMYEKIHERDSENLESLRFIVQILQDLGRPCSEYQIKLRKLEREQEAYQGGFVNFENDNNVEVEKKEVFDNRDVDESEEENQNNLVKNSNKNNNEVEFENDDIELPE